MTDLHGARNGETRATHKSDSAGEGSRSRVHLYSSDASTPTPPLQCGPLASERTSAMALMMTNSNNRWKAHRPNGRPPSLPPPGAVRKGGRCHAYGRGRSFNKGGKFLHKSTQSCSIGRSLRSFPASISATPGTKKHSGSAIRPLFSCWHQFGTLSYNRNKLQSRIHFETA